MSTRSRNILISGAGIAGPTLAYWLLRRGFTPTIVEQAPSPRSGGYVIDFWGLGWEVAERMGLTPLLRRDGYRMNEVRLVNKSGRPVARLDAEVFRAAAEDRFISIHRGDLARIQMSEGSCSAMRLVSSGTSATMRRLSMRPTILSATTAST